MRAEKDAPREPLGSMAGSAFVWVEQLVSVLASNMSSFALTIWAYQETGSATTLGLITACFPTTIRPGRRPRTRRHRSTEARDERASPIGSCRCCGDDHGRRRPGTAFGRVPGEKE
jgi:hypothetical protein